ncbi:MAG: SprT-like domain-containing protein [bacterium]
MQKELYGFKVDITYKQNMKSIKFRFNDGVIKITCPKISDKDIEKYLIKNYHEFVIKLEESKLSNNFTYFQGVKYNIRSVDEHCNNIIFNEQEFVITKGYEEKLIKELFINDIKKYLEQNDSLNYAFKGIEKPTYKIKQLKSSFGQYNKKNHTITLDYKLAKYDRIFLYLTLCHELCHMVHFDHSKEFYALLDTFVPNSKQMHKIMRKIKMNDTF